MKILVITSETPPTNSGFSRAVTNITSGLVQRGHHVDILARKDMWFVGKGEFRLTPLSWRKTLSPKRLQQYDLVYLNGPVPTISDFVLAGFALPQRPKLVYIHHCSIKLKGLGLLCDMYNDVHMRLARMADHVIVSTPGYRAQMMKYVPAEKISVVPYGVEPVFKDVSPLKNEQFSVLFVGQMRAYKGVDVLLKAMKGLPDIRLDVAGGGPNLELYRQMAEELGLENVTIHGRVSDEKLRELYARAHVLTLPSVMTAEAFGIVQLEGMAAGCVPIATSLPGVRDVARMSGLAVPPGDADALREAIRYLADHPWEWMDRSKQGLRIARRFSWERVVDAHERIFQQVLRGVPETAVPDGPIIPADVWFGDVLEPSTTYMPPNVVSFSFD